MKYNIPENAKIMGIDPEFTTTEKWSGQSGLHIETDKGDIKLLIDNFQSCCENYGWQFLETPDDISKYIGATIISIEDTNDRDIYDNYDCGGETQLKIVTNRGVLQYAVYNDHNGYYGHGTFTQVFDTTELSGL